MNSNSSFTSVWHSVDHFFLSACSGRACMVARKRDLLNLAHVNGDLSSISLQGHDKNWKGVHQNIITRQALN